MVYAQAGGSINRGKSCVKGLSQETQETAPFICSRAATVINKINKSVEIIGKTAYHWS